jgi:hypothetical protein
MSRHQELSSPVTRQKLGAKDVEKRRCIAVNHIKALLATSVAEES